MVKAQYGKGFDIGILEFVFQGYGSMEANKKGTVAVYSEFGGEIRFEGKNLEVDLYGNHLTSGVAHDITISGYSNTLLTIHGNFKAKLIEKALDTEDFIGIATKFLAGNDKVTGTKGDDEYIMGFGGNDKLKALGGDDLLDGGRGRDTMFGGGGQDVFVFGTGYGKDRIMDFDAEGGQGLQDLIHIQKGDYEIVENNRGDAVLHFNNKDSLTLVGVSADQIDSSDFGAGW